MEKGEVFFRIEVYVRRLGGAYGLKISRSSQVAVASGLVSYKLNRPCRFMLPLTSMFRAIGKRLPCSTNFEVQDFINFIYIYLFLILIILKFL